ncbi:heterogeneous nuclear ribonucleoprotein A1, A2/B1 homolog [Ananas comosus]|uniref:Heterogeneous nuclear ribonucleoprotein A1, A2/B1 homolog n=1 Tax=Ananas comosus TaxID=4615 RepID=A0A6P5E975_ANACO|nr:heterogeneous nuclear ribonucleoprotein A1, A2/B1 homolog [Ananas comosus]
MCWNIKTAYRSQGELGLVAAGRTAGGPARGGRAVTGGAQGSDGWTPEAEGKVVLPSVGGGGAWEPGGIGLGPHGVWAAAGDLSGGRQRAGTAGRQAGGCRRSPEGGEADGGRRRSAKTEVTQARPGLTAVAAGSSRGSGRARGWPESAGKMPKMGLSQGMLKLGF